MLEPEDRASDMCCTDLPANASSQVVLPAKSASSIRPIGEVDTCAVLSDSADQRTHNDMIRHGTYLIVVQHVNGTEELILLQDAVVVGIDGSEDVERVNIFLGERRGYSPFGFGGRGRIGKGAKGQLLLVGISGSSDGAGGEVDKARGLADHGSWLKNEWRMLVRILVPGCVELCELIGC